MADLWIYGFPCAEVWKIPALCDRIDCLIYEAILTSDLTVSFTCFEYEVLLCGFHLV